jgi:GNAT superfamily N-acetyltransferase
MSGLIYTRHSGEQMLAMLEDVTDLYEEIHSQIPDEQDGIFSRSSFTARTTSQARTPGFQLVTAKSGDLLVGFSFGYPLKTGGWWGDCSPVPEDILNSSKFAVIELDVRLAFRRQGIAKTLLDMLLSDRSEDLATLASTPGTIANSMYKRWGWYQAGTFTDSMEALLLPLKI